MRTLQQALAQRKLTIEQEERKMARAFMASIVPPHAGLLYEEVNERLNEATRNLLSHMVATQGLRDVPRAEVYTCCRRGGERERGMKVLALAVSLLLVPASAKQCTAGSYYVCSPPPLVFINHPTNSQYDYADSSHIVACPPDVPYLRGIQDHNSGRPATIVGLTLLYSTQFAVASPLDSCSDPTFTRVSDGCYRLVTLCTTVSDRSWLNIFPDSLSPVAFTSLPYNSWNVLSDNANAGSLYYWGQDGTGYPYTCAAGCASVRSALISVA